jgi:hypothetical protein
VETLIDFFFANGDSYDNTQCAFPRTLNQSRPQRQILASPEAGNGGLVDDVLPVANGEMHA